MLPHFTFINGPKESGKGTLAKLLRAQAPAQVCIESFAQPIRDALLSVFWPEELICGTMDLTESETKRREMPFERGPNYRAVSEEMELFPGNTIRDTMISFSEDWMKARWGSQVFGKLALRRCQTAEQFYRYFVFDDCGFADELLPVVEHADPANCLLIRLSRTGKDFAGDSRSYIEVPSVRTIHVENNGTPTEMLDSIRAQLSL